MSLFDSASICITPNAYKAGTLYAIKGADLTVTRATSATRVNANGLIETVGANVPRLDYTNGSCPSILVEPQRTNLVLRSEEFDNASWIKSGVTVTANQIISPDGNLTADLISTSSSFSYVYASNTSVLNAAAGGNFTFSSYIKAGTATTISLLISSNTGQQYRGNYNLSTGVPNTPSLNTSVSMVNMGNGWYRCILNAFNVVSRSYTELTIGGVTAGLNFYLWGAQLEAGSNATSYIKTEASAVTRNADVITKTGISDLIGQTEGTVFWEGSILTNDLNIQGISLSDGTIANRIVLFKWDTFNQIRIRFSKNSITQAEIAYILPNILNKTKIAITYKPNNVSFFVNGVLIGQDTSVDTFDTNVLNRLGFDTGTGISSLNANNNLVALWKTALTDQECINLTTI